MLDNINLEEYDMYTQDTESILNINFMKLGYASGGKFSIEKGLLLRYYKISNKSSEEVVEEYITFHYNTEDYYIYVLEKITTEEIKRNTKIILTNEI